MLRRSLTVVAGLVIALASAACSTTKECSVGYAGNSVKCTESNSGSDFVGSISPGTWVFIGLGALCLIGWIAEQSTGSKTTSTPTSKPIPTQLSAPKPTQLSAPKPQQTAPIPTQTSPSKPQQTVASSLRPGDWIVGTDGSQEIRYVTWETATKVRLTYSSGTSHLMPGGRVVTKLPKPVT